MASQLVTSADASLVSPVPILKVMRLQAPDLSSPCSGSLGTPALPSPSLSLPDSFGVIHIGETFTAYLGILNPSSSHFISHLSVVAQLQTPSRKFTLPSRLDSGNSTTTAEGDGGVTLAPLQDINAIVSKSLEEVGQHSLRVEVLYAPNSRTLRKFYRFQVASPLHIRELTVRGGDSACFVSIAIENATEATTLVVGAVEFLTPEGLEAERISATGGQNSFSSMDYTSFSPSEPSPTTIGKAKSAVELFDCSGRLPPGASYRYIFHIRAVSPEAQTRGIAVGDVLGKAIFTWHKTMGEAGRIASADVVCPPSYPSSLVASPVGFSNSNDISQFVMHKSGLSVDVAASAADIDTTASSSEVKLDELFPVTVDPIDPPSNMTLGSPSSLTFCVINHSDVPLNLQVQFRLPHMYGIVVSGKSFLNVGEVSGYGGSAVLQVSMLPLMAGLCQILGCFVVDLNSGKEVGMPPLCDVFVDMNDEVDDEKKER